MRITHVQKTAAALLVFAILIVTQYPGRAVENTNQNATVAKCTKRFNSCIDVCNHKYGTDRAHDASRNQCGRNCEDKLIACEEAPDRTAGPGRPPVTQPGGILDTPSGLPSQTPVGIGTPLGVGPPPPSRDGGGRAGATSR